MSMSIRVQKNEQTGRYDVHDENAGTIIASFPDPKSALRFVLSYRLEGDRPS